MLLWPSGIRVYLYVPPADMRRGFDSLRGMVREVMRLDPLQGHLFLFLNKRRTHLKLLWFDRGGLAIFYKRLEAGTFQVPSTLANQTHVQVTTMELASILEGIDLRSVRQRKRYTVPIASGTDQAPQDLAAAGTMCSP